MIITADLTTGTPVLSSDKVGEVGENNAVTLKIYPERDMLENENIVSYCVKFLVADGIMASQTYPQGNPIEISLWSALTDMEILSWQLEANDSDGNLVMKSVIVNQYLDPSLVGSLVTPGTTEQSLVSQVGAFAAELAEVEAEVAGKQDELTFDNVPTMDSDNPVKSGGVYSALAGKQNTLTAGANITISGDTISAAGYTLPVSTPTTLGGVKIDGTSLTTDASGVLHSKLIQIVDSSTSKSKYTPAEIWSMWSEGYGFKINQYTVVAIGVDSILSPTEAELILLTPLPKTRKATVRADKSYVVGSAAADFSEVNFTSALNTKLAGIEAGAEVNDVTDVQDKSGNSLVTNKIAKIQTVPTPTSADASKAIVVDSNGAYVLDTVGGGSLPTGTADDDILVWDDANSEWDTRAKGSISSGNTGWVTGGDIYTVVGDIETALAALIGGN